MTTSIPLHFPTRLPRLNGDTRRRKRRLRAEVGKVLAKHQPCGCIICTCEDEIQCQGCGAKHFDDEKRVLAQRMTSVFQGVPDVWVAIPEIVLPNERKQGDNQLA